VKHPFLRRYPSFTAVHFWMLWCSEWARIGIEHAHRAGVLDEDGATQRGGHRFGYWACARCGEPCAKRAPRCRCET
jgi:hypothetical protein